jgi:urea transport system ATP-binding protein
MLAIEKLNQYYGGSHILRDVSLEAKNGECTVLLGRNGVGKTTLLRCLMGVVAARSGSIDFEGESLTRAKPFVRARHGIGYVPQGREIFPRLSVEENLRIGLAAARGKGANMARVYDLFPALQEMRNRRGGDLSGGQQQQLAIGRALMSEPRLLVLDEPTEGIQPSIIKDIGRVLQQLVAEQKMTVLLVEQYYDFAAQLAHRYYVMARGVITHQGEGRQMQEHGVRDLLAI